MLPGMTVKAYLIQFALWVFPLACAAFAFGVSSACLRFLVAGFIASSFVVAVEVFRWFVCRRSRHTVRHNVWFADYDEVDYSKLLSPVTCRMLLPPKRSRLHVLLCLAFSFTLVGSAAATLDFQSVRRDVDSSTGAAVLSTLCLISMATAHFGLVASLPVEVSVHHYDPFSASGILADFSRPILVLLLFSSTFLGGGVWLRGIAASLPLLWSVGVVPHLNTLLSWLLDQLEVVVFGGSPMPSNLRLVLALASSATAVFSLAVSNELLRKADSNAAAVTGVLVGLPLAGVLVTLPPQFIADIGRCFVVQLGCAELQVMTAGLLSVALLLAFNAEDVGESLGPGRSWGTVWTVRVVLEQVGLGLSFVCARCNWAAHLGWPNSLCTYDWSRTQRGVAFFDAIVRVSARVVLLVHTGCYGVVALRKENSFVWQVAQAIALFRVWRISLVNIGRGALDAWIAGVFDIIAVTTQVDQTYLLWSLSLRITFVSILRQRFRGLQTRAVYAMHTSWASWSLPKLRHPAVGKLLVTNLLFFPLVCFVLVLSALIESPLVVLFTLPLFIVGYPRPRHGHPELGASSKGIEGLFYRTLTPSLFQSLVSTWRSDVLTTSPGSMIFCRSHERLGCVVRVLGAGLGWVQVELRGLEMQEPTSCHHMEAGWIDKEFLHAFGGDKTQVHRRDREESVDITADFNLFIMRPVCKIQATTYEQTIISMRGILDHPETLLQLHRLFLKTLMWVMAQHLESEGFIPRTWLTCPFISRDAQGVLNVLRTSSWTDRIASTFAQSPLSPNRIVRRPPNGSVLHSSVFSKGTTDLAGWEEWSEQASRRSFFQIPSVAWASTSTETTSPMNTAPFTPPCKPSSCSQAHPTRLSEESHTRGRPCEPCTRRLLFHHLKIIETTVPISKRIISTGSLTWCWTSPQDNRYARI